MIFLEYGRTWYFAFVTSDLLTFRNQEAALHCDMYLHHLLFNLISTGQWTHFPTYIIKSPRKTFHCFNFLSNNLLAKQIILYTRDLLSLDSWRASQRKSMITSQTSKRQTFVIQLTIFRLLCLVEMKKKTGKTKIKGFITNYLGARQ